MEGQAKDKKAAFPKTMTEKEHERSRRNVLGVTGSLWVNRE